MSEQHSDTQLNTTSTAAPVDANAADTVVEEDLLVEDVSIDGMCGVY